MRRGVDFDSFYLSSEREEKAKVVDGKWVAHDPEDQKYVDEICDLESYLGCELESGDNVEFIRDHDFPEYAKSYAEDVYDIDTYRWPFNHIDWEAAAEGLEEMGFEIYEIFNAIYLIRKM